MSISKAQAAALAEGFLDDIGSSKEGLQPRKTMTEIILLAGELIESAQKNLNASNSNASGKLSASLIADEPDVIGTTFKIDVLMNYYGAFVNKGVKGTRAGSSNAGYSFKTEYPSQGMLNALMEGIDRAKKSTRNTNVKKTVSKNEVKNASIAAIDKAWGAARNIKMYGIAPTGFMDKAILTTRNKMSRLGGALGGDILDSLK